MLANEQFRELRAAMHRLRRMPLGGQLKEVRVTMRKLRGMPTSGQLREVRATMRRLLWKMLHVLTLRHFCILISNRKHVMQIVRLTRANESNFRKSVAKKFETLIVKHIVPNVSWIM
jgi:hypothetical protein